jgi:hypothetical protein
MMDVDCALDVIKAQYTEHLETFVTNSSTMKRLFFYILMILFINCSGDPEPKAPLTIKVFYQNLNEGITNYPATDRIPVYFYEDLYYYDNSLTVYNYAGDGFLVNPVGDKKGYSNLFYLEAGSLFLPAVRLRTHTIVVDMTDSKHNGFEMKQINMGSHRNKEGAEIEIKIDISPLLPEELYE